MTTDHGPDLTIAIPTKQEAQYLPRLLDSIGRQGVPAEVIVADAGSTDATRDIATQWGCKIVEGGLPAVGRNNAARAGTGDTVLFLDADIVLPDGFLESSLEEFSRRGLVCATTDYVPMSDRRIDRAAFHAYNGFARLTQRVEPIAGGFCIFAKRDVFNKVDGFDPLVRLAEDLDFVARCAKEGDFGILHTNILYDIRRLENEGRGRLLRKYVTGYIYRLSNGEMRESVPFDYVLQGGVNVRTVEMPTPGKEPR